MVIFDTVGLKVFERTQRNTVWTVAVTWSFPVSLESAVSAAVVTCLLRSRELIVTQAMCYASRSTLK